MYNVMYENVPWLARLPSLEILNIGVFGFFTYVASLQLLLTNHHTKSMPNDFMPGLVGLYDYSEMDLYPYPSLTNWTYLQKYRLKASSGGSRASV